MKNLVNMMAYAAIVILGVFVSMSICSCSEDYSDMERVTPTPPPTPKDTTTTTPTPNPDNTWRWSAIMDQTVNFDTTTEVVTANNIAQLTKQSGETKLDSAQLKYNFGVAVTAPTRVVTMSPDTTVYTGKGKDVKTYGDFVRIGNDSLRSVTTVVEGGFRTQYYTVSLTTDRKEGFSLHAGKWLAYKNVTETSQFTSIWHEDLKEVEQNDSIFNREKVHNVITITLKSDKGQKWTVKREKTVVVDHFIKLKEEEKKEEKKVTADEWVTGLGRLVSLTKCLREDSRLWCDVALLEGGDGYTMIIDTYNTDGGFVGREKKFVSFEVCPKSNDYDGVAYINGGFYPAAITYDSSSRGWVLVSVIKGAVKDQSIDARDADARGIKNFKNGNTAYPWPYMTNTSTSKEVNGKKVITIMGKTSTRSYRGCVVADSSLKK